MPALSGAPATGPWAVARSIAAQFLRPRQTFDTPYSSPSEDSGSGPRGEAVPTAVIISVVVSIVGFFAIATGLFVFARKWKRDQDRRHRPFIEMEGPRRPATARGPRDAPPPYSPPRFSGSRTATQLRDSLRVGSRPDDFDALRPTMLSDGGPGEGTKGPRVASTDL
ncbi:hypothetical protein B0T26DRAFT_676734 [Lasiosphaeria miniovina]|uniref:Uncharacterized protein n=1 Tax=Lasiosphaeria miniovina TaxID=1954250 RepID=A0AA40AMG7_9PEZI|nr:uncharacterized protein B0T26DRAFT_676734 [Lasiosphaeria miniovina]KAK0718583.1 hypothetical protein B0T26DRAFT_676734 [Lasiosphaeria miniovina]